MTLLLRHQLATRRWRLFTIGAILLVGVAAVTIVISRNREQPQIKLRYLGKVGSDSHAFSVTNLGTNELAIVISAIEVRSGQAWSNWSRMHVALNFPTQGVPFPVGDLAPHAHRTSTVHLAAIPTNAPWRVKALVSERVHGLAEISRNVMDYRRLMEIRRATGDTGITVNPLHMSIQTYGRGSEAFSEEVPQKANHD